MLEQHVPLFVVEIGNERVALVRGRRSEVKGSGQSMILSLRHILDGPQSACIK
jgi:hypothetical protein